jgi:uncharacterized membrane protein YphA (DoxX/SURF4 family)
MPNWEQVKKIIYIVCYYFIAGVLLFSGIAKIVDPMPMIETLNAAKILNEQVNIFLATILPVIEISLGIMLILQQFIKATKISVTILFTLFLLFTVYGNIIGLDKDCGCFGDILKSEFNISMIVKNFLLLALNLYILITTSKLSLSAVENSTKSGKPHE